MCPQEFVEAKENWIPGKPMNNKEKVAFMNEILKEIEDDEKRRKENGKNIQRTI